MITLSFFLSLSPGYHVVSCSSISLILFLSFSLSHSFILSLSLSLSLFPSLSLLLPLPPSLSPSDDGCQGEQYVEDGEERGG